MIIDSHAHIEDFAPGVDKIINVGTSLSDSEKAIALAQRYPNIYASVGIHPNDDPSATVDNVDWKKFEELAKFPKVVAIGETGLDYSRGSDRDRQAALFEKQISIASKLNLPLSIHIRDAQEDLMTILDSGQNDRLRGVFHCFSGNVDYLNFILEKLPNFYISFAGNITFKNAKNLQELAKLVPLERLLIETDSPYLAPEPLRGTQNVPANVKITAQTLAKIKNTSFEEIAATTTKNAETLFKI